MKKFEFNILYFLGAIFILSVSMGCASPQKKTALAKPLNSVPIDIDSFMGVWHEVARLPVVMERHCVASSFSYKKIAPDRIKIYNFCWYKSLFGPMRRADTIAFIRDQKDPGSMTMQISGPIAVPYSIFYISKDEQFALFGSPDRDKLWILSRVHVPPEDEMKKLLNAASDNGFDVSKLIYTIELNNGAGNENEK
ncbi:MAG: lipocalin family protein [Deltaproteobacteria bacterium]|nr:lipocalin family protein [Deltaproteobacteria bacterium]